VIDPSLVICINMESCGIQCGFRFTKTSLIEHAKKFKCNYQIMGTIISFKFLVTFDIKKNSDQIENFETVVWIESGKKYDKCI